MNGFLPVIASVLHLDKGGLHGFCGFRDCWEPVGAFGGIGFQTSLAFPVARLAGSGRLSPRLALCFLLSGETELGSAEEQPNKG